jgi:uncharacterized protein
MALEVTYPGVYVSESSEGDLSIAEGDAVVPLILQKYVWHYPNGPDIICLNNLQDLYDLTKGSGDAPPPGHDWDHMYYRSIYAWFALGGGKCYTCCEGFIDKAVQQYDDINLIVEGGKYNGDLDKSSIVTAVEKLVGSGRPIFALLDGPKSKITSSDSSTEIIKCPPTSHAAIFYPWCLAGCFKNVVSASQEPLAPSIVAAIAIAKTDSTRGVWKAPCNVPVSNVTPYYPVSDDLQGKFNQGMALNMIRAFPDTGTILWGARTLEDSDNWRYIPVRRLFNMVEKDIKSSLNKLVFEPNSQPTWQRAKSAVDNYLHRLWQKGALVGNKAEEAYFVQIGKNVTMTQDDITQGKMIMKIGLAAVRPAEFIILQFSQDISQ